MNNLELPQVLPQRFSTCDRHPDQLVTGFCAPCLRERLAGLDPANPSRLKSSTTTSTAASALKAIFRGSGGGGDTNNNYKYNNPSSSSSGSFFAQLRRSKSFSGGRGEGFSGVLEPQRKSCDVRGRSTLLNLFNLDDERKGQSSKLTIETTTQEVLSEIEEVETRNFGFSGVECPVFESNEEDEEEEVEMVVDEEEEENKEDTLVSSDEIVASIPSSSNLVVQNKVEEIVEEIEEEEAENEKEEVEEVISVEEMKTMKDHINLESYSKKPPIGGGGRDLKEIAGSFWLAASVFSKKLQKWRKNQKMKKSENGGKMRVEKQAGRNFRETQSEIADYGFGRRSCDTDPRFSLDAGRMSFDASRMSFDAGRMSLDASRRSIDAGRMSIDAGRMSFDDPRYSWDEPRASWDGYLIGKMFPRIPPMVSVTENCPAPIPRVDNQIPVEEPINGGSFQTNDYYSDSTKRKSLDRSNSIRKMVVDVDEMKSVSNSKVSPANIDYLNGIKLDRFSRSSYLNSSSLRDDRSESFDSAFRDGGRGGDRNGLKKSRRWSKAWNIWAFIHRRGSNKDGEERYSRDNMVDRSFSGSWPELRREFNGEPKMGFNRNVFRSNSSVSWRNQSSNGGLFGSRRYTGETNENSKKRREDFTLERNRSARYSPKNIDNGMLRFYLTPSRGGRRSDSRKNRQNNSYSSTRNVLSIPRLEGRSWMSFSLLEFNVGSSLPFGGVFKCSTLMCYPKKGQETFFSVYTSWPGYD